VNPRCLLGRDGRVQTGMRLLLAFAVTAALCSCGRGTPSEVACTLDGVYEIAPQTWAAPPACNLPGNVLTLTTRRDGTLDATGTLQSICDSSSFGAVSDDGCTVTVTGAASCVRGAEPQGFDYRVTFAARDRTATVSYGADWCPSYPREVRDYAVTITRRP